MTTRVETIKLFDKIDANLVGAFIKDDIDIQVVRPGFDTQGRSRPAWTQFVIRGVPIFEVKVQSKIRDAIAIFESRWDEWLADIEPEQRDAIIDAAIAERVRKFKDGRSDMTPGPATTIEGGTKRRDFIA